MGLAETECELRWICWGTWSLAQLLSSGKQEGLVGDSALGSVLGEPMGLRQLSQAALCSVAPSYTEPRVEEDTASVSRPNGEKPPAQVPGGPSGDARGP